MVDKENKRPYGWDYHGGSPITPDSKRTRKVPVKVIFVAPEVTNEEIKEEVEEEVEEEESHQNTDDFMRELENELEEFPCFFCNYDKCMAKKLKKDLEEIHDSYTHLLPEEIRFRMYKHATYKMNGWLGKHNRKKLPNCVVLHIRSIAPSDTYKGFQTV
jgi:hypothetical protein